jgi:nucleoside-diphosphate-sugar epimerase
MTIKRVAVTGGFGNLGTKLLTYLAKQEYTHLVAVDVQSPDQERLAALQQIAHEHAVDHQAPAIEYVQCDLSDWYDRRWQDVVAESEAVVHFAARNPYPEATWEEAAVSLDMTLHVATAAADSANTRRFVFATSNHVMGRYKDSPLADQIGPGELTPAQEPGVGTLWHTGEQWMDSTAYATAKFAGERLCKTLAQRSGGDTTFVGVRIGWCQPGENSPRTLSASGSPTLQGGALPPGLDPEDYARAERWFREMWLSNRDFVHLFERAIQADADTWPTPFLLVNGMSANSGMKWSLEETKRWLGYQPQDDVYAGKKEE